jgi:thiol-disulfide isomerase/thioredoxin
MAFCLGLAGCSSLGRTPAAPPRPAGAANLGSPAPVDPVAAPPAGGGLAPAGRGGILAGQVVDAYGRRPPATFIQVVDLQSGSAGAPVEVAADSQGYFTIQGLQPGRHYQLTARAQNGKQLFVGTALAVPPNPKLVIRVNEEAAAPAPSSTPAAAPSSPATAPPDRPAPVPAATPPTAPRRDSTWVPGREAPAGGDPVKEPTEPTDRPRPITRTDPSRITNIPAQVAPIGAHAGSDPRSASPEANGGSAQVPSCVLTGQVLHNFALHDLNGQPWEYRTQRRGRLVLLDFWHSQCYPCLDAIRHLAIWQQSYGPYGLEVVGIAYEEGTPQERVQKVNRVRQRLGINYRLLMGGDRATCPVRTQFGVLAFPTVVLLDETGRIIWRSEGLGPDQIREVEIILKQRLGVR